MLRNLSTTSYSKIKLEKGSYIMPSGYTYHIYDGTDLNGRNFMLRCAKEFLPESRDGSLDDLIADEIHPDNYCSDQLQKDIEELKKFDQMTDKDIKEKLEKSYKNATRDYENRLDEIHKMRKIMKRY